jgi:uridine kinase
MNQSKIIGIGGVSRAGKSTLSRLLRDALSEHSLSVDLIHQDDYVFSEEVLITIKDRIDWELPSTIDWARLKSTIALSSGQHDIVILEGLFAFYDPAITKSMDHRFFIRIPKHKFLERKKEDLRWGKDSEPQWYIEHIWKSYKKYGIPNLEKEEFIVLSGTTYFDITAIIKHILSDS